MIKVDKSQVPVPGILNSDDAKERRKELSLAVKFPKGKKYSSIYQHKDVRDTLEGLYHDKCCYCEIHVHGADVEHFRPKSLYPWLAFSWDNLLLACSGCNRAKNKHFEVIEARATFSNEFEASPHTFAVQFNLDENSQFFHPELEDPEPILEFKPSGEIRSDDPRMNYTIQKCKLDKGELNRLRKDIKDDFFRSWNDKLVQIKNHYGKEYADHWKLAQRMLIREFLISSIKRENEFLGFRRYMVRHLYQFMVAYQMEESQMRRNQL